MRLTSNVMTPLSPYLSNILSMKYCSAGSVLLTSSCRAGCSAEAESAARTTTHGLHMVATDRTPEGPRRPRQQTHASPRYHRSAAITSTTAIMSRFALRSRIGYTQPLTASCNI